MNSLETSQLTGARKAAILLSLLGDEPAAIILRNLPDHDLELVTDEVARLGQVPFDVTLDVLEESHQDRMWQHVYWSRRSARTGPRVWCSVWRDRRSLVSWTR
jgi:flagellar motor switch protein FliG